jgi:NodT family efflux transporter outer membrane factor (OMF) lipoprotein
VHAGSDRAARRLGREVVGSIDDTECDPPSYSMSRPFVQLCLVLLSSLSACSLVPRYHRPSTVAPARWNTTVASISESVPVASGWWHSYGDPTLDRLVDECLQHNYSLASAVATVDIARGNAEKAGAGVYPSATVNANAQGGNQVSSNSSITGQFTFAQASYELDFWGLNRAMAASGRQLVHASELDRDTVAMTLTASVVDSYFQLQALRRRVALADMVRADGGGLLELLLERQKVGVTSELQIQQQRAIVATYQAALAALQQQLEHTLHLLATLTGATAEGLNVPEVPIEGTTIPEVRPDLPPQLLDRRPDIRAQEVRLQAANFDVGAARAAFFPTLTLTADGGVESASLTHSLATAFEGMTGSILAPLFDGGARSGQLHAARASVEKNIADYRQTVLTAFQDVEDALTEARQQTLAERSGIDAAEAAKKALMLSQAAYRAGTTDFLNVLDSERISYQAQDALVQARLGRLQASVSVFRAFGGGYGD